MRPSYSMNFGLVTLLWTWVVCEGILGVAAARNVTIDDSDPRVIYEPKSAWFPEKEPANRDKHNQTTTIVTQRGATATLRFTGEAIYWTTFGALQDVQVEVSVDGIAELVTVTGGSRQGRTRPQMQGFAKTGLSLEEEHEITIRNINDTPCYVDAFIVTEFSPPANLVDPPTATATADAQPLSNNAVTEAPKESIGVLVGLTISAFIVGAMFGFFVHFVRTTRKALAQAQVNSITKSGNEAPSSGSPSVLLPSDTAVAQGRGSGTGINIMPFGGGVDPRFSPNTGGQGRRSLDLASSFGSAPAVQRVYRPHSNPRHGRSRSGSSRPWHQHLASMRIQTPSSRRTRSGSGYDGSAMFSSVIGGTMSEAGYTTSSFNPALSAVSDELDSRASSPFRKSLDFKD